MTSIQRFIKEKLICKIASFTRKRHLTRLDPVLRKIYNPDKRQRDFIERIILCDSNLFFKINTSSYLEWTLFFYGKYEPFVSKIFEVIVKEGDVAIDVGANIGIHALKLGRLVGNTGTVYAFEPHPLIFKKLVENTNLNKLACVEPIQAALSEKSGAFFLKGFADDTCNQGVSFLLNTNIPHNLTTNNYYKVKTFSLDDWTKNQKITRLNLIKIDVEGLDIDVIYGAQKTIAQFRPTLLFEFCPDDHSKAAMVTRLHELHNFLEGLCYRLYIVQYNHLVDFKISLLNGNTQILAIASSQKVDT